ncbi:ankyrin repeat domain-containing protein [Bacteriovorax sp. Seq25_V]|uniref:ankyrin repeat domain-containing protein n=1 Tax=Bacteriovorax sp. Seq25_V TaxID=1201288 RepID=UPI00038A03DC|nr:ankyrin repeat domain-containing protein [Bacteriovorax sp. Seq25_V]EQC46908.1 ankyrin repeat protein [Bacteriovorax sp. Seq25_V]
MTIDTQTQEILVDAVENDAISVLIDHIKRDLNINEKLSSEETLLHKALQYRKFHISQQLVLLGADINSVDQFNRSPLHHACRSGFYEGAKLLTLIGVNLNQQDHKGRIPLMHAIKFKQMPLVKLLMSKGSDSDIEDNNGFNSLMWAVMHLSPEELKEMMSASEDDGIEEKMEQTFVAHKENEIKVANETFDAIKDENIDSDSADERPTDIPDVIREQLPTMEQAASYSIKEHLASLREKAEQDGFDYQIVHESEDEKDQIIYEDGSTYDDTIKTKEEIETASYSIDRSTPEKSESQPESSEDIYRITSNENTNSVDNERQTVTSTDPSLIERESITVSQQDIKTHQQEKIHVGEYQINVKENEKIERPLSSNHLEQNQNENTTVAGHTDVSPEERTTVEGISEKTWETSKLSGTDHIKEDRSFISGNEHESDIVIQKLKRSEEGSNNEVEDDFMKVKHLQGGEEQEDENSFQVPDSTTDEQNKVILDKKKNITYLRDGFKDEYKDEYGQIRTVDKNVEDDTFGILKSDDRVIKDEYGEITTVNKEVEPSYETKELRRSETPQEPSKARIISGSPEVQQSEKITVSESNHQILENEKIKRPELLTPGKQSDSIDIKRTEGSEPASESSFDRLNDTVKSAKNDKETDGYIVKGSIDEDKNNDVIAIKHLTSDAQEEKENEKSKEENTEELTEQEQKVLENAVDPNMKNAKGQTLCWIASEKGQVALLKKLILQGADYEIKDTKGLSCLMIASLNGHTEVVDYLAHKVRNIDEKRTDGHTALSLAIEADRADCARILIDNSASIDTKIKGNTLLMQAASVGALNSIKLLIMLGQDPIEKNFRGKTALDLAKTMKQKKAFMILGKIVASRIKKDE